MGGRLCCPIFRQASHGRGKFQTRTFYLGKARRPICLVAFQWICYTCSTFLLPTTYTNQWDRGKVHAIVNPDTREDILKIKLSNVALRDRLIWKENKANKFSKKTSYQVALRLFHPQTGEHSLASMDRKMWKRIWSLNFPPKVRNFIWRVLTFCQLKQIWFKRKCEWTPSVMCLDSRKKK